MTTDNDEDRLLYLLSASCNALPSSYIKLRSYLNIHSAKLAENNNLRVFKSRQKLCPYCFTPWNCETSSFKLLPSKKPKITEKKTGSDQKETSQELRNTLVLKCKVCTKKSFFSLVKKKNIKANFPTEEILVKKKKKKKDKSSGLLINMKSAGPSPKQPDSKKKAGVATGNSIKVKNPVKTQSNAPKNSSVPRNESLPNTNTPELVINPFSHKLHQRFCRKTHQKLKRLKKAVKGIKDVTKKSFKDFLTLI